MSIRINNKIIAGNGGETKSTSYRYVGEIFQSTIPIDDIKVACLDGHKIYADDGYGSFIQYLISQSLIYPQIVCTEEEWLEKVGQYGSWGKFVINTQENSVRLPKIAGFLQGTVDINNLADLIEAGLPNIEGQTCYNRYSGYSSEEQGVFEVVEQITSGNAGTGNSAMKLDKVSFDASLSNSIYGNSDTVQPQAIQYPYYIVLATGVVQEINIKDEVHLNNPFFFGMYQYFETEPNNLSWLKSEGQWNSGSIYESFYEWLVNSYNDTESGVSVKLNSDTYTNFDYVLNQNDKTFRLPIEVKQKFYNDISGSVPVAGNGMALGLTDGTSNYSLLNFGYLTTSTDLGLKAGTESSFTSSLSNALVGITTDPTKSGIEAQITQTEVEGLGLYFYVGETVEGANVINGKKVLDILPKKLEKEDIYKGITNCLLEVPQRIKLELSNGTLTLKAGSEITHPSLEYQTTIVSEDKTYTYTGGYVSTQALVFVARSNGTIQTPVRLSDISSGNGAPTSTTSGTKYFDASSGIIYYIKDTKWVEWAVALPVAVVTINASSVISSIDQVFNGFGYIGTTIWMDKGVNYLIPSGRNEDGTLKSYERSNVNDFVTRTLTVGSSPQVIGLNTGFSVIPATRYQYNEIENLNYITESGVWNQCAAITLTWDNGTITNFKVKQPFRALDYNDKQEIISWGTPDYNAGVTLTSTLKASPYSFTPPCDGIIRFHVSGEQCWLISRKSVSDTSTWAFYIDGATGVHTSSFLPVNRGETIYCVEQRTGHSAIFYPYKGAK